MQVLLDVAVNTSAIVNTAVFVVWVPWDVEECAQYVVLWWSLF